MSPGNDRSDPPLGSGLAAAGEGLRADLLALLTARGKLLRLELQAAAAVLRRAAVASTVGGVLAIVGLAGALVAAAPWLEQQLALPAGSVLPILSIVLLAAGLTILTQASRRFRRDFAGLRDTLAETQEDVLWLREILHRGPRGADDGMQAQGDYPPA
ncbi:MAG: phage holin family protein [Pirellulales bacterium]|nr:phage holin family protein [Pirellulales bacterium]